METVEEPTIRARLQEIADRWEARRDGDRVEVDVKAVERMGDAGPAIGFFMRATDDMGLMLSLLAAVGHRIKTDGIMRCEVTDNPVGTDTWGERGCQCETCRIYVALIGLTDRPGGSDG